MKVEKNSRLLFSFSKEVWAGKSEEEQRSYFAEGNVHIFGGKPQDVGGVKGWDKKSLNRVVDLYQERTA